MISRTGGDPLAMIKKELKRRRNPAAAGDGGKGRRGGRTDQSADLAAETRPKKTARPKRKPIAKPSPFGDLPDDLKLHIFSQGTLQEAVRSSSLLSKRWSNMWRLIGDGVLDFDECHLLPQKGKTTTSRWPEFTTEDKRRFADRVDQAVSSHVHPNLDALRIGFDLFEVKERVWRWVEFAFAKRVKELTLLCSCDSYFPGWVPLPSLNSDFLSQHDLSRLQVLEFFRVAEISQAAIDHILNHCPSLQSFTLRDCHTTQWTNNGEKVVIRVCCSSNSNLRCLDFDGLITVARVELISAPRLHTFKFREFISNSPVEFGDGLPQLREALLYIGEDFLPWSRSQFSKFGPRLERLGLEVCSHNFLPRLAPPPEWLVFEKLRVLDLFMYVMCAPPSFLECAIMLRAAPMLRELFIWFRHLYQPSGWERRDLGAESSEWKHPSLEVLQLHGVSSHPVHFPRPVDGTNGS